MKENTNTTEQTNATASPASAEKQPWEKAADVVMGDNKLMNGLVKLLLSPVTLVVGAGLILFWLYKVKGLKDELDKSKSELKKITDEKKLLEEDYEKTRKKYKRLKALNEPENTQHTLPVLNGYPFMQNTLPLSVKKTYNSAYLD